MSKPQNKAEALAHMEVQEARRWYQLGSGTWKSIRGYYKRQRSKARRREGKREAQINSENV
jgi:hypothetical protein